MSTDRLCEELEKITKYYQMPEDHREIMDKAISLIDKLPSLEHDLLMAADKREVSEVLEYYLPSEMDGQSPGVEEKIEI